ncbi:MAG TPA: SIS domain-containing protein [Gaiella sp.]|nr:SIS domain-containing protein [Gaiella sp.]
MSPAENGAEPGMQFLSEIREQPAALRRLLEHDREVARIAAVMRDSNRRLVRMVGHGSSDNAASYGVYAFGLLPRWTAMRDSITLTVHYETPVDMSGSTVIGLSQSGRTPDVVEYVKGARAAGAFTVAVTNSPSSKLARVAEATIPLAAEPEHAVAATKTYVNTLGALALLAGHVAGRGPELADGIRRTSELVDAAIPSLERSTAKLALSFSYTGRMFVIGRGVEFATAREIALKLLETCRIAAEPLTATDLAHGPVAALDPLFPVWAIASNDGTLATVQEAATRTRRMGATLVASGTAADRIKGAAYTVPVPTPQPALLSPLVSVVPGQLFAAALARARGLDADAPHGLAKVTLAR